MNRDNRLLNELCCAFASCQDCKILWEYERSAVITMPSRERERKSRTDLIAKTKQERKMTATNPEMKNLGHIRPLGRTCYHIKKCVYIAWSRFLLRFKNRSVSTPRARENWNWIFVPAMKNTAVQKDSFRVPCFYVQYNLSPGWTTVSGAVPAHFRCRPRRTFPLPRLHNNVMSSAHHHPSYHWHFLLPATALDTFASPLFLLQQHQQSLPCCYSVRSTYDWFTSRHQSSIILWRE